MPTNRKKKRGESDAREVVIILFGYVDHADTDVDHVDANVDIMM
jgi:hypothetical protein